MFRIGRLVTNFLIFCKLEIMYDWRWCFVNHNTNNQKNPPLRYNSRFYVDNRRRQELKFIRRSYFNFVFWFSSQKIILINSFEKTIRNLTVKKRNCIKNALFHMFSDCFSEPQFVAQDSHSRFGRTPWWMSQF